jgi:hypothetical protein
MLNSVWIMLPFVLQMLCMTIDEFVFHKRRGLPRWERIGHPLDTATVLICFGWVLSAPPSPGAVAVFTTLGVFSTLFVTKDEFVHNRHCTGAEQWLHALLFILHPSVLASVALLWPAAHAGGSSLAGWVLYSGIERAFLLLAAGLTLLFGIYQFVYWNLLWRPANTAR